MFGKNLHSIARCFKIILHLIFLFFFSLSNETFAQQNQANKVNKNNKYELDKIQNYPVIFIQAKDSDKVRFEFAFHIGGVIDEKLHGNKLSGLSHFLEHVLTASSINYPFAKHRIWEELVNMGNDVNAETGEFTTEYYWEGSSELAPKSLERYSELLFNPEFSDQAIEVERATIQDELRTYLNDLDAGTVDAQKRILYEANSPYLNDILGDRNSINNITKQDLVNHWNQFYRAANTVIVIAGDFANSPELKKNLKDTLSNAIQNSPNNPFYDQEVRNHSNSLPLQLENINPTYQDSKFRQIQVNNKDILPEFNLRMTFKLDPEIIRMNVFTVDMLKELLILESLDNPIYLLKLDGLASVPTFHVQLEESELSIDVSLSVFDRELANKLERQDLSMLNYLTEPILARVIQVANSHIDEPYARLAKNLIKNQLELESNDMSQLCNYAKDYLSVIGKFGFSWVNIVRDLNEFYASDSSKALEDDAYSYAIRSIAKPVQSKNFKLHWNLISKQSNIPTGDQTPYKGIRVVVKEEAPKLEDRSYANLKFSRLLARSDEKDNSLVEELLRLSFGTKKELPPDPSKHEGFIQVTQRPNLTMIKDIPSGSSKHQTAVIRFENEAEDTLSHLNLEMFLHSFLKKYSKEIAVIRSYLTNFFVIVRNAQDKQILDFSFTGESEAITEIAPRVLGWFSQHKVNDPRKFKHPLMWESKKTFSNEIESLVKGSLWELSFEALALKSQNFRAGIEDARYYLSDASTFTAEDLDGAKHILSGSQVTISLAGKFSDYQAQRIEDGAMKILDLTSKLVVAGGVKKRRLSYSNLDREDITQLQLPLNRDVENENAVLVHSLVQLTPHIQPSSYFLTMLLSKMLYRHVYRITNVENSLGYYHATSFSKNHDGLHAMFSGIVESKEDPLVVKDLLYAHWQEAAHRLLQNENGESEKDFHTIRQSILSELRSEPNPTEQAYNHINSWFDFRMHEKQLRIIAIHALENSSFQADIVPLVKKLLPKHSSGNRLTYMIAGNCEYLFRERIE